MAPCIRRIQSPVEAILVFSSDRSSRTQFSKCLGLADCVGEVGGRSGAARCGSKAAHAHPRPSSNEAPSLPSRDHTLRHARRVRPPSKVNRKFAGTSFVHVTCRHAPLFVRLWTTQSTPNEWPIKKILASFSTRVRRALRLSSMISHCLPRSLTVVICPSVHSCLCSFY